MRKAAILAVLTAGSAFIWQEAAMAHDWYPIECCHHADCAPVHSVVPIAPTRLGGPPRLIVTTIHGRTLVPEGIPVQVSKDGRMHICVNADPYGDKGVMCLFMPPSM
jgi:hypothetical protein